MRCATFARTIDDSRPRPQARWEREEERGSAICYSCCRHRSRPLSRSCTGADCRFSRPQKNARHLVFSEIATIGTRNRQRCFMFRLANMRSTQLLNPRISVYTTSFYQTEVPYRHIHLLPSASCTPDSSDTPGRRRGLLVQTSQDPGGRLVLGVAGHRDARD